MGPEAPVVGIGSHRSAVSHKPICLLKWLPGQSSPTPRSAVTCVFQPAVACHKAIKNHLDLSVPDDPAEFAGLGAHVPPYCPSSGRTVESQDKSWCCCFTQASREPRWPALPEVSSTDVESTVQQSTEKGPTRRCSRKVWVWKMSVTR